MHCDPYWPCDRRTDVLFLRKKWQYGFEPDQGSAGMAYRPISSKLLITQFNTHNVFGKSKSQQWKLSITEIMIIERSFQSH